MLSKEHLTATLMISPFTIEISPNPMNKLIISITLLGTSSTIILNIDESYSFKKVGEIYLNVYFYHYQTSFVFKFKIFMSYLLKVYII